MTPRTLQGPRYVIGRGSAGYPELLESIAHPPDKLYVIGSVEALQPGLAVVGARKATPYGKSCAERFAGLAAQKGVVIISGGARGCDAAANRAAVNVGGKTVVFLGGGCDEVYPAQNFDLFQQVIDAGGAVVSENEWTTPPLPFMFRARNRLIAGLAHAVLIVEAGLPSGTFSTADEALASGREVLAVPGAITAVNSRGANRLIYQGATPIIDDESFEDVLFALFGALKFPSAEDGENGELDVHPLIAAILAQPLGMERLHELALELESPEKADRVLNEELVNAQMMGIIARQPDGKWCARA